MTMIVTGGAGYIGSHTVRALHEANESVVVVDNLSTGFSAFIPEGVPLFIGDAGDENLVEGVIEQHGVEAIIHFAGSIVVPESIRDPLLYYRNNTMTTQSLLKAAVKHGVNRFIFSSTAAVYGEPDQVPVPEHARTRPMSPVNSSFCAWPLPFVAISTMDEPRICAARTKRNENVLPTWCGSSKLTGRNSVRHCCASSMV